jgi:hypothetical protein
MPIRRTLVAVAVALFPLPAVHAQSAFDTVPLPEVGSDYRLSFALGDVDGDGIADLVLGRESTLGLRLGRNGPPARAFAAADQPLAKDGARTFGTSCESNGNPRLADLDADGDLDLVLLDVSKPHDLRPRVVWLANDGKGTFSEKRSLPTPAGGEFVVDDTCNAVDVVDWDGDGRLDLLVAGRQVLLHRGVEGGFSRDGAVLTPRGRSPVTVDWDRDGDLDLLEIVAGKVVLFERRPEGLAPMAAIADAEGHTGQCWLAVVDWNGDGTLDLVLSECHEQAGALAGGRRVKRQAVRVLQRRAAGTGSIEPPKRR